MVNKLDSPSYKMLAKSPREFDFTTRFTNHSLVDLTGTLEDVRFAKLDTHAIIDQVVESEWNIVIGDILYIPLESGMVGAYEVTRVEKLSDLMYVMDLFFCGYRENNILKIHDGYGIVSKPNLNSFHTDTIFPVKNDRKWDVKLILVSIPGFFIIIPMFILNWWFEPLGNVYKNFWHYLYMCYTYPSLRK